MVWIVPPVVEATGIERESIDIEDPGVNVTLTAQLAAGASVVQVETVWNAAVESAGDPIVSVVLPVFVSVIAC